jgi:hypothetical protein
MRRPAAGVKWPQTNKPWNHSERWLAKKITNVFLFGRISDPFLFESLRVVSMEET